MATPTPRAGEAVPRQAAGVVERQGDHHAAARRTAAACTGNGRGSPTGPSHHVATPSSRLAFHTPLQATNTRTHVAAVDQPPARRELARPRGGARRGVGRAAVAAVVVSTDCDGTAAGGRTGSRR